MTISVQPVTVAPGATQHKTPVDQDGNPIAIANAVVIFTGVIAPELVSSVATVTYDATGAIFTGVEPGAGNARWQVTEGQAVTYSDDFLVTVTSPVTAVGDTSP